MDFDEGEWFGRVVGIRDVVTFRGPTPEDAEREFRRSVDVYLDFCRDLGQAPCPPTYPGWEREYDLRMGEPN